MFLHSLRNVNFRYLDSVYFNYNLLFKLIIRYFSNTQILLQEGVIMGLLPLDDTFKEAL